MNEKSWEYANDQFNTLKRDYTEAIASGAAVLPPEFINHLNPDDRDSILHLMCNDGREAAYLSHEFDCDVYGVDFSSSAIAFAEYIDDELDLDNTFVKKDVYRWLGQSDERGFTKAMTTLGSIRWIHESDEFFRLLKPHLRESGTLVLWDFHPIMTCFDAEGNATHDHPIDTHSFIRDTGVHDYVSSEDRYTLISRDHDSTIRSYSNTNPVYFTHHSISDLINSAISNGFVLSSFHEYGFLWEEKYLPWLEEVRPRRYEAPESAVQLPLTFLLELRTTER